MLLLARLMSWSSHKYSQSAAEYSSSSDLGPSQRRGYSWVMALEEAPAWECFSCSLACAEDEQRTVSNFSAPSENTLAHKTRGRTLICKSNIIG